MFNGFRQGLANLIAPSRYSVDKQGMVKPMSRVLSYEGTTAALRRKRKTLQLDEEGLATAAAVSVWAARCIEHRARAVAGLEWYVTPIGQPDEKVYDTAWHRAMLYAYKRWQQNLLFLHEYSLSVFGECYMEPLFIGDGTFNVPGGVRRLSNIVVTPVIMNGIVVYYEYAAGASNTRYKPDELFFDKYENPLSDLRGLSPLVQAMDSVNISEKTTAYFQSFYDNDATPGGALTARQNVKFSDDEVKQMLKEWKEQHTGVDNAFKILFLPWGLEYKSYDNNPPANQPELNEEQRRDICAALEVPMALVDAAGVSDPLSAGSTMNAKQLQFVEGWLDPEVKTIKMFWNSNVMPWLCPGYELACNIEDVLQAARQNAERSTMLNLRLDTGGISINEWREDQGYEKLPGWDVHLIPAGKTVVKQDDLVALYKIGGQPSVGNMFNFGAGAPPATPLPFTDTAAPPALPGNQNPQLPSGGSNSPMPSNTTIDIMKMATFPPVEAVHTSGHAYHGLEDAGASSLFARRYAYKSIMGQVMPDDVRRAYQWFATHTDTDSPNYKLLGGNVGKAWVDDRYRALLAYGGTKGGWGTPSLTAVAHFDGTVNRVQDLLGLAHTLLPDWEATRIQWTPADLFHITLVHVPLADDLDEQALNAGIGLHFKPFSVQVNGLGIFEHESYNVLYAKVEGGDEIAMRSLQEMLYGIMVESGAMLSNYSEPQNWKPHITLAYVDKSVELPKDLLKAEFTFTLNVTDVMASRSEYRYVGGMVYVDATTRAGVKPHSQTVIMDEDEGVILATVKAELLRWQKFSLKRLGKSVGVEFETEIIPATLADDIRTELQGAQSEGDVRAVFSAAIMATQYEDKITFSDRLQAAKTAQIDEQAMALLIERLKALGADDLLQEAEAITGESTDG